MHDERGTLDGIRDMAEIYAGIRPRIVEAYSARRVWQLDTSSFLGFDTALAASTPEGFVVPRAARTDPTYAGLRGDYYVGTDFNALVLSRTECEVIDFDTLSVVDERIIFREDRAQAFTAFTVRWSGQVKPRDTRRPTYYASRTEAGGAAVESTGDRPPR